MNCRKHNIESVVCNNPLSARRAFLQRSVDHPHVGVEGQQCSERQFLGQHFLSAEIPDDDHTKPGKEGDGGEEDRAIDARLDADIGDLPIQNPKGIDLPLLLRKRFDHPNTRQRLSDPIRQIRPCLTPPREESTHAFPEHDTLSKDEGHRNQRVHRQFPAHVEQEAENPEDHHAIDQQIRQAIHEKVLEATGVSCHTRHESTHLPLVVELERQHLESAIQLRTDVGRRLCAKPSDDPSLHPFGTPAHHTNPDQRQNEKTQQPDSFVEGCWVIGDRDQDVIDDMTGDQ